MTWIKSRMGRPAHLQGHPYNPLMQPRLASTRRAVRGLVRLMLAWFVLSIGAAVASPWIKAQGVELVCAGSGAIKLLVHSDEGAHEIPSHTLDCPLCVQTGAPPSLSVGAPATPRALDYGPRMLPASHTAARTAAPLPARGPPCST